MVFVVQMQIQQLHNRSYRGSAYYVPHSNQSHRLTLTLCVNLSEARI